MNPHPENRPQNKSSGQGVNRRGFMTGAAGAGLAASMIGGSAVNASQPQPATPAKWDEPFAMRFAPHPGMFRASAGNEVLDQIKFAHDQGFTAWEHNSMPNEEPEKQEAIGTLLRDLKMEMGVFVAYADFERPTFAVKNGEYRDEVLARIRASIEIAQRCGAKHVTVVPGTVDQQAKDDGEWNRYGGSRLAEGFQTANVIELLRECAGILEPHGIVMVLEPLNWFANHGGLFLQRSDQAYAICKAVNSPSCKILFDIYHQQITEGNLIPNISACWDEISYFQCGDNPGRKEPGTGEIHYANLFRFIQETQQANEVDLVMGMEHGNSERGEAGEAAVIAAYREVEPR